MLCNLYASDIMTHVMTSDGCHAIICLYALRQPAHRPHEDAVEARSSAMNLAHHCWTIVTFPYTVHRMVMMLGL